MRACAGAACAVAGAEAQAHAKRLRCCCKHSRKDASMLCWMQAVACALQNAHVEWQFASSLAQAPECACACARTQDTTCALHHAQAAQLASVLSTQMDALALLAYVPLSCLFLLAALLSTGVWPEFALVNHSCAPNTVPPVLVKDRLLLRTALPVPTGEELTTSYLGLAGGMPLQQRRQLLQHYGFTCNCQRCKVSGCSCVVGFARIAEDVGVFPVAARVHRRHPCMTVCRADHDSCPQIPEQP